MKALQCHYFIYLIFKPNFTRMCFSYIRSYWVCIVLFGPHWSILSTSVPFGSIRSNLSTLVLFGTFSLIRSTVVLFSPLSLQKRLLLAMARVRHNNTKSRRRLVVLTAKGRRLPSVKALSTILYYRQGRC